MRGCRGGEAHGVVPATLGGGNLGADAEQTRLERGQLGLGRDTVGTLHGIEGLGVVPALKENLREAVPELSDGAVAAQCFEDREAAAGISQRGVKIVLMLPRVRQRRVKRSQGFWIDDIFGEFQGPACLQVAGVDVPGTREGRREETAQLQLEGAIDKPAGSHRRFALEGEHQSIARLIEVGMRECPIVECPDSKMAFPKPLESAAGFLQRH